jgi:hypothetical protein
MPNEKVGLELHRMLRSSSGKLHNLHKNALWIGLIFVNCQHIDYIKRESRVPSSVKSLDTNFPIMYVYTTMSLFHTDRYPMALMSTTICPRYLVRVIDAPKLNPMKTLCYVQPTSVPKALQYDYAMRQAYLTPTTFVSLHTGARSKSKRTKRTPLDSKGSIVKFWVSRN